MASSAKCNVCMEEFTKEGERCPKLLPCTHTVCLWCLTRLQGHRIRCPECRLPHQVPGIGPRGFPTNRYVLEILDLLKANQRQNAGFCGADTKEEESILCEHHQRPCVMFCLEMECWNLLCPKCSLHQHQEHNLVSLAECLKDSGELEQMKQRVSDELVQLHKHEENVRKSKSIASKAGDEAVKAINKKVTELKRAIDRKADEMRKNVERSSAEQEKKLAAVLVNIHEKCRSGRDLKNDIENRPRNFKPQAIQHVSKLKKRLLDFQMSSKEERNKILGYDITRFKPIQTQDSSVNPLGELVINQYVIQKAITVVTDITAANSVDFDSDSDSDSETEAYNSVADMLSAAANFVVDSDSD